MYIQLRCNARYMHRGQFVRPGDVIECTEPEAKDLLAMRMASAVEQTLAERIADAAIEIFDELAPERAKRKYSRRDMRAQD